MNIILAGYTGLTGSHVLHLLLQDDRVKTITCVGRTPPLQDKKINFIALKEIHGDGASPEAHATICCIGTTIKRAGSQHAFRNVDFGNVQQLAKWCSSRSSKFVLMSSVGADAGSTNFYLRVKGETEKEIRRVFNQNVYIVQPSLLLGKREESRPLERLAQGASSLLSPLFPKRFSKYKPVHASDVAAALVSLAIEDRPFKHPLLYDDIMQLAARAR